MTIRSIVIVSPFESDWSRAPAIGEIPGPWDSEESAIERLLDGQRYEVRDGVIYAECMSEDE